MARLCAVLQFFGLFCGAALPAETLGRSVQIPFDAEHVRVVAGAPLQVADGSQPGSLQRPASLGDAWATSVAITDVFAEGVELVIAAATGPTHGVVEFAANGTLVGTFDGYSPNESVVTFVVGTIQLAIGTHDITGKVLGKNESSDGMLFQCEFVELRPYTARRQLQTTTVAASSTAAAQGLWIPCQRAAAHLTVAQVVEIGSSTANMKIVALLDAKNCSSQPLNEQLDSWSDQFEALVAVNSVIVRRIDSPGGWQQPLVISCNVYQPETPTHYIGAGNELYVCQ